MIRKQLFGAGALANFSGCCAPRADLLSAYSILIIKIWGSLNPLYLCIKSIAMAKSTKPVNAPSTTGNPSGGGRGNNPPKPKK